MLAFIQKKKKSAKNFSMIFSSEKTHLIKSFCYNNYYEHFFSSVC